MARRPVRAARYLLQSDLRIVGGTTPSIHQVGIPLRKVTARPIGNNRRYWRLRALSEFSFRDSPVFNRPNPFGMRFYFHVNGSIGIVQKIDYEIRPDLGCTTPKTSRKVVLDNLSVCLSVCPSVCLSVCLSCCRFSRELSQA